MSAATQQRYTRTTNAHVIDSAWPHRGCLRCFRTGAQLLTERCPAAELHPGAPTGFEGNDAQASDATDRGAPSTESFELTVQLTEPQAQALVWLVHRVGDAELRACAAGNPTDAGTMRSAVNALLLALGEAGFRA